MSEKEERQYELMTRVATMYYMEDQTQEQIAKTLGLSRIKIGRLLKKARQEGIVEINVRLHPNLNMQLESELIRSFGLKRALIAVDQQNHESTRAATARLVAGYFSDHLREGMVVTVGMGRNCGAVADYVFSPIRRNCTFISAMGGSQKADVPNNPDHICRRLAERFGGTSVSLYAPAYVENKAIRDTFLNQEDVRQTLTRARKADLALVGIGDISLTANVVNMGCVSPQEMSDLAQRGAVGDILGCDFNIRGVIAEHGMRNRVVGLSVEDLRSIPNVIAVASEPYKVLSVLGALRTGLIGTLVTSARLARMVLDANQTQAPNTKSGL